MSTKRQSSGGALSKQRRGSSAASTTQPSADDALPDGDELNDTQLRVLYELNAIKAILDDVNASLHALVRTTAPGGRLYESQQLALNSLAVWERLFRRQPPLAAANGAPIAL